MVRSELMDLLARKMSDLPSVDVVAAGNLILSTMEDAICDLKRIELRGIGSWKVRKWGVRIVYDPLKRKKVVTSMKYRPHFKPGKNLRLRVDRGAALYPTIKTHSKKKKVVLEEEIA